MYEYFHYEKSKMYETESQNQFDREFKGAVHTILDHGHRIFNVRKHIFCTLLPVSTEKKTPQHNHSALIDSILGHFCAFLFILKGTWNQYLEHKVYLEKEQILWFSSVCCVHVC